MQGMLSRAQTAGKCAGLTFNPKKCASLTICRSTTTRQRAAPSHLTLEGEKIPTLSWEDKYKYLGCKVGADLKADLSPEDETLGAYQLKANSSQRGPICGIHLPELIPKSNPEPVGSKAPVRLAETVSHGEGVCDADVQTYPPMDQQPCCSKSLPPYRALPRPPLTERGTVTKCGSPLCTLCPILLTNTSVRSRLSRRQHYIYGQFTPHQTPRVPIAVCQMPQAICWTDD